jgi:hypothetical protein
VLHTHNSFTYHRRCMILANDSFVKWHTFISVYIFRVNAALRSLCIPVSTATCVGRFGQLLGRFHSNIHGKVYRDCGLPAQLIQQNPQETCHGYKNACCDFQFFFVTVHYSVEEV